jgi:hypothetical protein
MGRSVDDFYDHLKTSSDAGRKLPNWCVGRFYLPGERCGLISLVDKAWRAVSRGEFTERPCLRRGVSDDVVVPPRDVYLAR